MSVYRHKDSPFFHYDFIVQGRRFHGSTHCADKNDARIVESAKRTEAAKGLAGVARRDLTLDEAGGGYWSDVAKHQSSADNTEYQLENLVRLLDKDTMVSAIGDAQVAAMISTRRGEPARNYRKSKDPRRVSPATVNREVELLRRVLYRARKLHKVVIQPIDWREHKLHEADGRDPSLSVDAEQRLIDAAAAHLKPAIRFALLTGVRLGNCIGLDWQAINLVDREISFRVKSRKVGGAVHVLPINADLDALLRDLDPQLAGPVFKYRGRAIKSWRTAYRTAKKRAGLDELRWHDLRHVVGTRITRSLGIAFAQEFLGHADIATTRRYAHHETGDKLRAMDVLSRNSPEVVGAGAAKALKGKG